jgi:hypothetical protein
VPQSSLDEVENEASAAGVPLTVIQPPAPVVPDLYSRRLTLIRPDQHVAWRGDNLPGAKVFRAVAGVIEEYTESGSEVPV